ncbi:F-box and leucine-rich repeat protein 6, isoform CRA_a [Mus musculus]|nr:F-box and leucine-rich repeat protein 6, isoform CRA_a [Mus musculus]
MAPVASRRVRRRVRSSKRPDARGRSAEDWWWDRLAPRGSGYHLLQADSMLLVLPDLEPPRARAHRRARRRAPRSLARGPTAVAKPRTKPRPEPSLDQGLDSGWGDRIPLEVLVHIFGLLVAAHGPMPFLGSRHWHEATSHPSLWHTVTLSPSLVGRAGKGNLKGEKKLLACLEWLVPNRFSQLQSLTLIHWKSQVHSVLELVSKFCPRLTFLKLSDCHTVTAETLVMLARACCQLHSLDLHHSMVSPLPWVGGGP